LHYYQPYFTLVGGGVKRLGPGGSHREISDILDKRVAWIRDRAVSFDPDNSKVVTHDGKEISYDFLVVSMGISTNYGDVSMTWIISRSIAHSE
jgi:sulfide:quinone oxidoreductase